MVDEFRATIQRRAGDPRMGSAERTKRSLELGGHAGRMESMAEGEVRAHRQRYDRVQDIGRADALLEVSQDQVCGWLNWAFADTPTSQDLTRWSGIWTEDLELKPWGEVFGRFAREQVRNTSRLPGSSK